METGIKWTYMSGSASSCVQDELIGNLLAFAVRLQSGSRFVKFFVDEIFARKMTQNHVIGSYTGLVKALL